MGLAPESGVAPRASPHSDFGRNTSLCVNMIHRVLDAQKETIPFFLSQTNPF